MKRLKLILLASLLLLAVVFFLARCSKSAGTDPRFVVATTQPTGPFGDEYCEWDTRVPLRDGKVWMWTLLRPTNQHCYLYDIDNRMVIGELLKGSVVLANKDHTKLLCEGRSFGIAAVTEDSWAFLSKITAGRIKPPTSHAYGYWILDLERNATSSAGLISEPLGIVNEWHASPEFRFGYYVPTDPSVQGKKFFLCDLKENSFTGMNFNGQLEGWWNDHTLLVRDLGTNFLLLDVLTKKTSTLLSRKSLVIQFQKFGLTFSRIDTLFNWNGSNFNVTLSHTPYPYYGGMEYRSFFVKLEHPDGKLKLVARDFDFMPLGNFNSDESQYVYSFGDGISLRDLKAGNQRKLVESQPGTRYFLPRFYGQSVIYHSNRVLYRIDLNTSNTTRFFDPRSPK